MTIMFKKVQTTIHANGQSTVRVIQIGIRPDQIESDMEGERAYFSKIATDPRIVNRIQNVEATETSVVVIYESGMVKIIQWVAVPE
jgi:hypothetical protein